MKFDFYEFYDLFLKYKKLIIVFEIFMCYLIQKHVFFYIF